MHSTIRTLIGSALLATTLLAQGAEGISSADEAFLRGFFDHQWLAINYDQLALKKGSQERVRQFAQSELDMYRKLGTRVEGLYKSFALAGEVSVLGSLAGRGKLDTNTNALVNDSALLESLSGEQFDRQFVMRVIMLHQRMMRHTLRQMQPAGGNAEILAFAKDALAALNQQNETAENIYNGRSNPVGGPPPGESRGAGPGGAPGAPPGAPPTRP